MRNLRCCGVAALLLVSAPAWAAPESAAAPLRVVRSTTNSTQAVIRVRTAQRAPQPVPRFLTGKFAEHLGFNIYHGMDAQILHNPTFADVPFWTGQMSPDGITRFHSDTAAIDGELRRQARRLGWPDAELDGLVRARADALAAFWTRSGAGGAVVPSPDTGPFGGRAQRLEVQQPSGGIAQWTHLPLHRVREYEFEIMARSPELTVLEISLTPDGSAQPAASATARGLEPSWTKLRGRLALPADAPSGVAYQFALRAPATGQLVLRHVFLWPSDQIAGCDPDVIRLLRESRLPLLRWPGGNFVSGYHWEDAVGPVERRPTLPNYAWGSVELNTFGTDEFLAFCRAVGCEPMICVNAGSGTPAEAARWVEYCNGPATSPMGRLRAANGHPAPYAIRHWEVGNELWGRWQYHWSTAAGYVDRFRQFAAAMRAADPSITLYACGAPVLWGKDWNDTLLRGAGREFQNTTDHPLVGGDVDLAADPLDVYRDFMAVPEELERRWAALDLDMHRAGIEQPRLAITELQLFAHLGRKRDDAAPVRLTRDNLVRQDSMTEAIYDVLIYHAAVRLSPFVPLITHSATVNHGGGLRKERERVWANPCHDAQAAFAAFAGATPVPVEIECAVERAPRVLPDLHNAAAEAAYGVVDALAAVAPDGALLISIVHRGTSGPVSVAIELPDFRPGGAAAVRALGADVPWAGNTREEPERIRPLDSTRPVAGRRVELAVPPYTLVRVRVPGAPAR